MEKYAKIIDIVTNKCDVAEGDDPTLAISEGFTIQDVERGYDGWYIKGFAPPPVNPRIEEIKQLLQANDIASVRPLRAKVAGTATDTDTARLLELESEAAALRQELASLTNQP